MQGGDFWEGMARLSVGATLLKNDAPNIVRQNGHAFAFFRCVRDTGQARTKAGTEWYFKKKALS